MKKLLLAIAVCATGYTASAQIPDYGVWPGGVVLTDINGNSHDIDAILDAGQSVVIDAFADWCGPCWTYHQQHTLEDLHNNSGAAGTNTVRVFGVEADPSVPEANISDAGTGEGDWTQGITYPLVNDDNLAGIINLGYYPTLILVCPDRSVTEIGQVSEAQWNAAIGNCAAEPTNADDPRLVGNDTKGSYVCGGSPTADVDLIVAFQNYTQSTMAGTYTVRVLDGGTEIATTDATVNLAAYEVEEINVGTVALPMGATNLTAEITTANDDASNDTHGFSVTNTAAQPVVSGAGGLTLDVEFDGWASEFGMIFDAGLPYTENLVTIHNDAAGGTTSPLAFNQVGSHANGDASTSINLPIAADGCYYLVLVDSYGDGLTYPDNGSVTITSEAGENIAIAPDYGGGILKVYDVSISDASIENIEALANLSVYPNPAVDNATIDLDVTDAEVQVSMVNALGQVVYTNDLGTVNGSQKVMINTSDLESGLYLVNISIDGQVVTERVSVLAH